MTEGYRLFKYRAINLRLIESIVNQTWYFARPDTLNDPFDCRVDVKKALARAAISTSGLRATLFQAALKRNESMLDAWIRQFEKVGVCAFSLESASELLWAHYADNHRGVVLTYQFDAPFIMDKKHKILGLDFVKYGQDAVTKWLETAPLNLEEPDNFVEELTKIYVTAKAKAWAYEEEVRIIRMEPGPFKVPRDALCKVIYGMRTPKPISNLSRSW